jgi:iron(III) transport system ATP-binding protein
LSGGQQQRVALARALVMEPKVLLFDEPLSNLDAKLRVQMRTEIRRIQQELGITSVYVTHDQDEAMVLSDQIVVMHRGRVQQIGNAALDIYRRPRNRFVADFIGRANFLPAQVLERSGAGWRIRIFDQTLEAAGEASTATTADSQALLMVRPESIRISPARPDNVAPAWPGIIARTSYLGSLAEYDVVVDGQRILAVRHDPAESDLYAANQPVYVQFLRENAYLLPSEV